MKKNNRLRWIVMALALAAASAWAAPADPSAPGGDPVKAAARQELMELKLKEKAQLQAVNTSNATPGEKKAARQKIRSSYRQQRQALRQKHMGAKTPAEAGR